MSTNNTTHIPEAATLAEDESSALYFDAETYLGGGTLVTAEADPEMDALPEKAVNDEAT